MNGILLINKEAVLIPRCCGQSETNLKDEKGWSYGTLDFAATGIYPALGKATRLSRYFIGADKSYRAVIRLGETTDTLDGDGTFRQRTMLRWRMARSKA